MSSETEHFILIRDDNPESPISIKFTIDRKLPDGNLVNIAYIEKTDTSYIKTVEDRLQNFVCTYEFYKEFIQLTDEAYDTILNETGGI